MADKRLRVHVCNDAAEPPALTLSPRRLAVALAGRPALGRRVDASFGVTGDGEPFAMPDADVLFTNGTVPLDEARRQAPSLRWVQSTSAGVEGLLRTLPQGLVLANASGVHSEKAGEFVLAAALMLNYGMPQFVEDKARQVWNPVYGSTLKTRSVLILGTGAIGLSAARALQPFGCRIAGFNRQGEGAGPFAEVTTEAGLDHALRRADLLVSTLPATPATAGLVDRRRLGLLPDGAGVVVVGRARVLDYDALFDRLDAASLSGAVLDVFPVEPVPPGDRAWSTPRLFMTPHCSVDDHACYLDNCLAIFLDNLERDLGGRALRNVVDPAVGY